MEAARITPQIIRQYRMHAERVVHKHTPRHMRRSRYDMAVNEEIEMLSAFFAHVRLKGHTEKLRDFELEMAESLRGHKIRSVLEVGAGEYPFCRFFESQSAPDTVFYTLGLEMTRRFTFREFFAGRGDIHRGALGQWFTDAAFDLIFSLGVHCYTLLPVTESPLPQVEVGNMSAARLVSRLSANPRAAFFASSYRTDWLAFERSRLEDRVKIDLWHERQDPQRSLRWADKFRQEFKADPATLVVMGRR